MLTTNGVMLKGGQMVDNPEFMAKVPVNELRGQVGFSTYFSGLPPNSFLLQLRVPIDDNIDGRRCFLASDRENRKPGSVG